MRPGIVGPAPVMYPPGAMPSFVGVMPPGFDMEQQKLIQQVLALTPAQIEQLPPEQRAQIQQIRNIFRIY